MRVRLRFSKQGKVRWTSHRDVARMWERAFRRVRVPLAYTRGFSPRPKLSFGLALPTGAESVAEYLDVELAEDGPATVDALPATDAPAGAPAGAPAPGEGARDGAGLAGRLTAALPAGIDVLAAMVVPDDAASLQQEVTSCSWELEVEGAAGDDLAPLVARALAADTLVIPRERKGQTSAEDIRPGILSCAVLGPRLLGCELATQPRGLRPSELVRALGSGLEETRVRRTHQWITRDGAQWEPELSGRPDPLVQGAARAGPGKPQLVPLDATGTPHATARASMRREVPDVRAHHRDVRRRDRRRAPLA